jgi:acyl carrier protein phosphodiesterase
MNYLAHAYLSFHRPGILVGNMISDFVKGKAQFDFPERIQQGITLHRAIDEFTDFHPVTQVAKSYFRAAYRLYSGAFVDIMYDHFLALDENEFPAPRNLSEFAKETYHLLDQETAFFPARFAGMYPYMKSQNWLYNYRTEEGIRNSFAGLVRRAAYMNDSSAAFDIFLTHYDALQTQYSLFFPELKQFVKNALEEHDTTSG